VAEIEIQRMGRADQTGFTLPVKRELPIRGRNRGVTGEDKAFELVGTGNLVPGTEPQVQILYTQRKQTLVKAAGA